ncbi:hypothetical protein RchiOBHm_Chr2g0145981 [Rosa chinensis]|uniref:Uncharacterized protein n=1 Tax=Rosa chinensis TaxID=74649 RepID=A0A2P6RYR5_ROSCH|nr:hypothetical protein RchiOBHm_Chr2g0145981 [Rosa chinensis]
MVSHKQPLSLRYLQKHSFDSMFILKAFTYKHCSKSSSSDNIYSQSKQHNMVFLYEPFIVKKSNIL